MIEKLAIEMVKLGWDAKAEGQWLRVEENRSLRTPEVRDDEKGLRYVWDGYVAWKAPTMAKRLDRFLRECGKVPASA